MISESLLRKAVALGLISGGMVLTMALVHLNDDWLDNLLFVALYAAYLALYAAYLISVFEILMPQNKNPS